MNVIMMSDMAIKFEDFHRKNPHVYRVLVDKAREWVRRTGKERVGISMLYEGARWEIAMQTSDENYKLSNDHRAFYARLIMAQEPDLRNMFVIKKSEATDWILPILDQVMAGTYFSSSSSLVSNSDPGNG
jgi:hypothetical protein